MHFIFYFTIIFRNFHFFNNDYNKKNRKFDKKSVKYSKNKNYIDIFWKCSRNIVKNTMYN